MEKIIIYSTSSCGYCSQAKAYFEENGIPFEDVNVEEDEARLEEMLALTDNVASVPVIRLGDEFIIGWSIDKFQDFYGKEEGDTTEELDGAAGGDDEEGSGDESAEDSAVQGSEDGEVEGV